MIKRIARVLLWLLPISLIKLGYELIKYARTEIPFEFNYAYYLCVFFVVVGISGACISAILYIRGK